MHLHNLLVLNLWIQVPLGAADSQGKLSTAQIALCHLFLYQELVGG